MSILLKNEFFNTVVYQKLTEAVTREFPKVCPKAFLSDLEQEMAHLELNDRITHTAKTLHKHLGGTIKEHLEGFTAVAEEFQGLYSGMAFPRYVALFYDPNDLVTSFKALEIFTKYASSEFAIRRLLRDYPIETTRQMLLWSRNPNEHIRRLSSEGLRPLLPWSFKLTPYFDYPSVSWPILNNLKSDPSLYVRKSVGNHLNDLTKLHPSAVLSHIKKWDQASPNIAWVVKKGLRTLIKNGDPEVFRFYGYKSPDEVAVHILKFSSPAIHIGDQPLLSVQLYNKGKKLPVILDFAITYCKKNGNMSYKVFKWKEFILPVGFTTLEKKVSFKQMSTRKHHPGKHTVTVLINGKKMSTATFTLFS